MPVKESTVYVRSPKATAPIAKLDCTDHCMLLGMVSPPSVVSFTTSWLIPAATPVPAREALTLPPPPVTESVPVLSPAGAKGAKRTFTVHEAKAGTDMHELASSRKLAFETAMLGKAVEAPVLLTVKAKGALCRPSRTEPKSWLTGLRPSPPAATPAPIMEALAETPGAL